MENFRFGHFTNIEKGTGCTVILCPPGTTASAHARGISPGTREFALLSPTRKMQTVNAVLLTGGSAFGLDAAAGVMQYLAEHGEGYETHFRKIPIVPAAVIYDLYLVDPNGYPTAADAYQACQSARSSFPEQGTVGAGTGATVGKWAGLEYAMKGGVGFSQIALKNTRVEALAVVNSVGDVVGPDNTIVAGAHRNGRFLAQGNPEIRWNPPEVGFGENTVLAVLMTNARMDKLQVHYLAERAHNGIVKSVVPAHTSYDGDVVFALAQGKEDFEIDSIIQMAIEALRQAIVNAVMHAASLGGTPALSDI